MAFVHLHTHTDHSALDGLGRVGHYVERAAELGMSHIAVTDHGNLNGTWELHDACARHGIIPIYGIEAYMALSYRDAEGDIHHGNRFEPRSIVVPNSDESSVDSDDEGKGEKTKRNEHLVLLAENEAGWRNLVRINNAAQNSVHGKPLIDYDLIEEHKEGILVLTGCLGGPILGPLSRGEVDVAEHNLSLMVDLFGADNVFVEVMEHGIEAERAIMSDVFALAARHDVAVIATNDSHFVTSSQAHAHDAWLAEQTKTTIRDPKRYSFHGEGYHLRTEEEMHALVDGFDPEVYEDWLRACDNTAMVAERITGDALVPPGTMMLKHDDGSGKPAATILYELVREGALWRYGEERCNTDTTLRARLSEEMQIIAGRRGTPDYCDYFLMVHDLLDWARSDRGLPTDEHPKGEPGQKLPILVGPGRGSAAGSVVSYCLNIVDVDPLRYDLIFERFMEPGREELPDIDLDFEAKRMDDVLDYLRAIYGARNVARIGANSKGASKGAILSACRTLGIDSSVAHKVTDTIGTFSGRVDTFEVLEDPSYAGGESYRKAVAELEGAAEMVEVAKHFVGAVKSVTNHACGIIVSDRDVQDMVPVRINRAGEVVSGWEKDAIESYGLLKLDCLALRNLDVVSGAIDSINRNLEPGQQPFDYSAIPDPENLDDPSVRAAFRVIAEGKTAGIFQMDSSGMTGLAQDVQPERLDDLTALVALYRPGPLTAGMHTHYAERKNGREEVTYNQYTSDPAEQEAIAQALGATYGLFVYQEDLMRLGGIMAGFDAKQRSKLRKAVSKKKEDLMREVGSAFIEGCTTEQVDAQGNVVSIAFLESTAHTMWEMMKGSAAYLFNKSHAAAYAKLAYVTAWMKANHPIHFAAAMLANTSGDEKRALVLSEIRTDGIEVRPPDINTSVVSTTVSGDSVVLGLGEIKRFGKQAETLVRLRESGGEFKSVKEMLKRAKSAGESMTVTAAAALIESGAADCFGPRMAQMRSIRAIDSGVEMGEEWGPLERSNRQRAVIGVRIDESPLETYKDTITSTVIPTSDKQLTSVNANPICVDEALDSDVDSFVETVYGVVKGWSRRTHQKGDYVKCVLEGVNTEVEAMVWFDTLKRIEAVKDAPVEGDIIIMRAKFSNRQVEVKIDGDEPDSEATETVTQRSVAAYDYWRVDVDDSPTPLKRPQCRTLTSMLKGLTSLPRPAVAVAAIEPVKPEPEEDVEQVEKKVDPKEVKPTPVAEKKTEESRVVRRPKVHKARRGKGRGSSGPTLILVENGLWPRADGKIRGDDTIEEAKSFADSLGKPVLRELKKKISGDESLAILRHRENGSRIVIRKLVRMNEEQMMEVEGDWEDYKDTGWEICTF